MLGWVCALGVRGVPVGRVAYRGAGVSFGAPWCSRVTAPRAWRVLGPSGVGCGGGVCSGGRWVGVGLRGGVDVGLDTPGALGVVGLVLGVGVDEGGGLASGRDSTTMCCPGGHGLARGPVMGSSRFPAKPTRDDAPTLQVQVHSLGAWVASGPGEWGGMADVLRSRSTRHSVEGEHELRAAEARPSNTPEDPHLVVLAGCYSEE